MGTIIQNLQSNADRLKELALIYELSAINNKWGDMMAVLPQILDIVTSTSILLSEIEQTSVAAYFFHSKKVRSH